jgi:multicomponent Na+:H+ antiporter subunit D
MNSAVHPSLIFFCGALLLPLLKSRLQKQFALLAIPAMAFIDLLLMPCGSCWKYPFLSYQLVLGRVDTLSLCFAYVFVTTAFLGMVYALQVEEDGQHTAALIYAGAALGVTFAGDYFTLLAFCELMAVASAVIIWYRKSEKALGAGFRYLMVHLSGGAALLAGIIMEVSRTGSIAFNPLSFASAGSYLILIGFLINAAVPPFNAWLSDAYPEATVTGSVFLSIFTTKSAVYVLLRGFPGWELLTWLGAIMALYGIIYALLENNIRRFLAYHIVSQVGFMVCGVGIGTDLSMNGSAAHAFCHILYKALLFMAVGAVIQVTGSEKITELQGRRLFTRMPICFAMYMVGALSISAVPLFNGFISKNMIVFAAGEAHRPIIYILLELASVGTFLSLTLKLPYGMWFGRATIDQSVELKEIKEPPLNMLIAMGMAALLCIVTGVYPQVLFDILPFNATYSPYRLAPVAAMLQLLIFSALGYSIFMDRLYGERTVSLDTDWFYRKGAAVFMRRCADLDVVRISLQGVASRLTGKLVSVCRNPARLFSTVLFNNTPPAEQYNPDAYRQAIGIGVMYFLGIFSLLCIIFFLYA